MIVQISGVLIKKNISEVVIESNGLGYLCFVSNNTFNQLPNLGDSLTLLTFLHITENKHTLYGFQSEQERNLFKLLISVSGIGPKIGIQLLSSTSTSQFQTMIINDDVKIWRGFLDSSNALIADPFLLYFGTIDEYRIVDSTTTANLVLNVTSHWGNFDKHAGRTTTDNSQQRFFDGDKGMEFSALTVKDLRWGRPDA